MTSIAVLNKKMILERIAKGDKLVDIGRSLGISQPAISKEIANDPEFKAARETGALARIEHWEKEIEDVCPGTEQVMLARAREMLSHARWRAEREFPERWGGQKLQVNVNLGSLLDQRLAEPLGSVIDQLPEQKDGG